MGRARCGRGVAERSGVGRGWVQGGQDTDWGGPRGGGRVGRGPSQGVLRGRGAEAEVALSVPLGPGVPWQHALPGADDVEASAPAPEINPLLFNYVEELVEIRVRQGGPGCKQPGSPFAAVCEEMPPVSLGTPTVLWVKVARATVHVTILKRTRGSEAV